MALNFTPDFSVCVRDNCQLMVITPDYYSYPEYQYLSSLTLALDLKSAGLSVSLDMLSEIRATGTGSVTLTLGSKTVAGTNTLFTTEFQEGDYFMVEDDIYNIYQIDTITSNTSLTITSYPLIAATDNSFEIYKKEFYVTPSDLGYTSTEGIPDDIYHFIYSFVFDAPTSIRGTYEYKKALSCHKECYVFNKIKDIPNYVLAHNCACDYVDEVVKSWMFLTALRYNAQVGGEDDYVTISEGLDQLIDFDRFDQSDCGCS